MLVSWRLKIGETFRLFNFVNSVSIMLTYDVSIDTRGCPSSSFVSCLTVDPPSKLSTDPET
jgi:hypothetical protein